MTNQKEVRKEGVERTLRGEHLIAKRHPATSKFRASQTGLQCCSTMTHKIEGGKNPKPKSKYQPLEGEYQVSSNGQRI